MYNSEALVVGTVPGRWVDLALLVARVGVLVNSFTNMYTPHNIHSGNATRRGRLDSAKMPTILSAQLSMLRLLQSDQTGGRTIRL